MKIEEWQTALFWIKFFYFVFLQDSWLLRQLRTLKHRISGSNVEKPPEPAELFQDQVKQN